MNYLVISLLMFTSLATLACDRNSAEDSVKAAIAQGLVNEEQLRSLKIGTVEIEEKIGERIWAVHAVFELEKFGRKVSENAVVFRFNNQCQVMGSSGARLKRVAL